MSLDAIRYNDGKLTILDQLLLPHTTKYIEIRNTEDGWNAIKLMQVRGAPAIAIVGCLSLAVELLQTSFTSVKEVAQFVTEKLDYLVTARPTAVNMGTSSLHFKQRLNTLQENPQITTEDLVKTLVSEMVEMLEADISVNKKLSRYGADHILKNCASDAGKVCVLTHCNTGSLATAGYGTALGVVRTLQEDGRLAHAYCTETRPYNQGARLTAYELVFEKIPSTLICDSMVSMLLQRRNISAIVVGADRVVANGDTANKIGTYQLAIAAQYHNVLFYVACPVTSYDPTKASGEEIVIEERPPKELTSINGVSIAAPGINCWNPAFDVTPAKLITGGIITEYGVFKPSELQERLKNLQK